ncbi:MAG: hypothetical protein AB1529_06710 [Candidatus Micrarchaeota archaeon]
MQGTQECIGRKKEGARRNAWLLAGGIMLAAGCGGQDSKYAPLPHSDASARDGLRTDGKRDSRPYSKKADARPDTAKPDSKPKPDSRLPCAGSHDETVLQKVFEKGQDIEVGGYYLTYKSYTVSTATFDIRCASDGKAVATGFVCKMDSAVSVSDGANKLTLTVHNKNTFQAVASVSVDAS